MEFDLQTLIGSIGLPGALCILMFKQYVSLTKTIERNTQAMYLIAGKLGVALKEEDKGNGIS